MMTPAELREYEFKGAGRNAYKSDDVDNFFGEVAVAYEKIFREKGGIRYNYLSDSAKKIFMWDILQKSASELEYFKSLDLSDKRNVAQFTRFIKDCKRYNITPEKLQEASKTVAEKNESLATKLLDLTKILKINNKTL